MKHISLAIWPILSLVAACGGGSTSTGPDYTDLVSGYSTLSAELGAAGLTPSAQMPTSGSATYDGYFSGIFDPAGADPSVRVRGEASLTANFAQARLSGSVTNLQGANDTPVSGTIALSNGVISNSIAQVKGSGNVRVDAPGFPTGTAAAIDIDLLGTFAGANARGLSLIATDGTLGSSVSVDAGIVATR